MFEDSVIDFRDIYFVVPYISLIAERVTQNGSRVSAKASDLAAGERDVPPIDIVLGQLRGRTLPVAAAKSQIGFRRTRFGAERRCELAALDAIPEAAAETGCGSPNCLPLTLLSGLR